LTGLTRFSRLTRGKERIMQIDQLTGKVIHCAHKVHNTLGVGFLEKVYANALFIELAEAGLAVKKQYSFTIMYREQIVGEYFADLVVEDRLIVELKAVKELIKEHEVQLVNYLMATGIDHGLLINFGYSIETKRKFRVYHDTRNT
jgi:GxxExxY protein